MGVFVQQPHSFPAQMNFVLSRFLPKSCRNPACQRSIQQSLSTLHIQPSGSVFRKHQEICHQHLRFQFVSFHTTSILKMSDEVEKAKAAAGGEKVERTLFEKNSSRDPC